MQMKYFLQLRQKLVTGSRIIPALPSLFAAFSSFFSSLFLFTEIIICVANNLVKYLFYVPASVFFTSSLHLLHIFPLSSLLPANSYN